MLNNWKVEFHYEGFIPGVDISEEELGLMRELYITMYKAFSTMLNRNIDGIKAIWEGYETLCSFGSDESLERARKAMNIDENATENDWIERWCKEISEELDKNVPNSFLSGDIFRDGDIPLYGVKFNKNNNWKMNFTLVEA